MHRRAAGQSRPDGRRWRAALLVGMVLAVASISQAAFAQSAGPGQRQGDRPAPVDPAAYPLGATVLDDGRTLFRVPGEHVGDAGIRLVYRPEGTDADVEVPMTEHQVGGHRFFWTVVDDAGDGTTYAFRFRSTVVDPAEPAREFPDAFARQAADSADRHGRSRVVDLRPLLAAGTSATPEWHGVTQDELRRGGIYELPVRASGGTFHDVAERIVPDLAGLGYAALELTPVVEAPPGLGYDGALIDSVASAHGGWAGLKELIDAAHAHGLAVIIDLQFNHLGPEASYPGVYASILAGQTDWGDSLNVELPWVREQIIGTVELLARLGVDVFRIDAAHDLVGQPGPGHILAELARRLDQLQRDGQTATRPQLILEMDQWPAIKDQGFWLGPVERGGVGAVGIWNAYGRNVALLDALDFQHVNQPEARKELAAAAGLPPEFAGFNLHQGEVAWRLQNPWGAHEGIPARCAVTACAEDHDSVANTAFGFNSAQLLTWRRLTGDWRPAKPLEPAEAVGVVQALARIPDWTPRELVDELRTRADVPQSLKDRLAKAPDHGRGLAGDWIRHARAGEQQAMALYALHMSGPQIPLDFGNDPRQLFPFTLGYTGDDNVVNTVVSRARRLGLPVREGTPPQSVLDAGAEARLRWHLPGWGEPGAPMADPRSPELAGLVRRPPSAWPGWSALTQDAIERRGDPAQIAEGDEVVPLTENGRAYARRVGQGDSARITVYNGNDYIISTRLGRDLTRAAEDRFEWAVVLDTNAARYGGTGAPSTLEGATISIQPRTTVQFAPAHLGLPNVSDPAPVERDEGDAGGSTGPKLLVGVGGDGGASFVALLPDGTRVPLGDMTGLGAALQVGDQSQPWRRQGEDPFWDQISSDPYGEDAAAQPLYIWDSDRHAWGVYDPNGRLLTYVQVPDTVAEFERVGHGATSAGADQLEVRAPTSPVLRAGGWPSAPPLPAPGGFPTGWPGNQPPQPGEPPAAIHTPLPPNPWPKSPLDGPDEGDICKQSIEGCLDFGPKGPELVLDPPRPEDELEIPAADLPEEDWDLCKHSVEGCAEHEPDVPELVLDPPLAPPKLCDIERGCIELPLEGLAAASMLNGLGARARPGGANPAVLATAAEADRQAWPPSGARPSTSPAPLTAGMATPAPTTQVATVTGSGTGVPAWMPPPASATAEPGADRGVTATGNGSGVPAWMLPPASATAAPEGSGVTTGNDRSPGPSLFQGRGDRPDPLGPGLVVPGAPGLQLPVKPGRRALPGATQPDGTKPSLDQLLRDGQGGGQVTGDPLDRLFSGGRAPAGDQGGQGRLDNLFPAGSGDGWMTLPDQAERLFGGTAPAGPGGVAPGAVAPEPTAAPVPAPPAATPAPPEVIQPAPDDLVIPGGAPENVPPWLKPFGPGVLPPGDGDTSAA